MADKNEEKEIKDFLALLASSIEENNKLLSAIEKSSDKNVNQRSSESHDPDSIVDRLQDANEKLGTLQKSCKANQVKLEKALKKQHQSRSTSASTNREKPRLTEEEQDIAYELKAQMMRSTLVQNAKLKNELGMVQKVAEIRAAHRNKVKYDSTLSRTTLLNLVRKYDKDNKEAGRKINDLEDELRKAKREVKRYEEEEQRNTNQTADKNEDDYSEDSDHESCSTKQTDSSKQKSLKTDQSKSDKEGNRKEDKTAKKDRTKKDQNERRRPYTATNVRTEDLMRRIEHLTGENQDLHHHVDTLNFENTRLSRDLRESRQGVILQHQLATSEAARSQLLKRVEKLQRENQLFNRCMTRQAADWIQNRRDEQKYQEDRRWSRMQHMSAVGGSTRSRSHKAKKNVDTPRTMYPPVEYATTA